MSESKSRYGIMEELTGRKLKERTKLADIERDKDLKEHEISVLISAAQEEIRDIEKNYVMDHKNTKREMEVSIRMLEESFNRQRGHQELLLKDEVDNYEARFQDLKSKKVAFISDKQLELAKVTKDFERKIKDKNEIIDEINKGVQDLKEVSAEQKDKK